MADTYTLHIAGLTRELPICKVNDHMDIAAFIMFSDVELTEACAAALLKKAPEFDVILTAEAKGIPLAYEMARQSGKYWIPARKGPKLYMREPVIIEDQSITTAGKQTLVIDKKDIEYMDGKRILIVDDSEMNRIILSEILQDEYDIIEASTGEECLRLLEEYGTGLALILLDIVMPGMDGFGVLDYMNRNHWIEEVPVIMISSEDSTTFVRRAYEQGVSDYISRPFDAKVVYQRVFNTIKLYAKQRRLVTLVTEQIYEKEKNNQMMISILSHIMEFRNGESGLHVHHINVLTSMLLERLVQKTDRYHLSWSDQLMITTASALHDIGKMGIDENILNKPGRLTKEEFEEMKKHTLIGASMLKSLELYQDEKLVQIAYQICRWHHERYDGKGYPDGLKGEEIPIAAQVVSIADVYDALTSERVYKSAYTHEKAIEMILNGECGTFSPLMLECLLDIKDAICEELNTISEEKQTSIQIEKLNGLSPVRKLNQGFAYVEEADGGVVKSIRQVEKGDELTVYVTDGLIRTSVKAVQKKTYKIY